MTQEQYGQTGPRHAAPGETEQTEQTEETEETEEQARPVTRFQKVASALRGGGPDRDEPDYWDEPGTPAGDRNEAVAVTSPDIPVIGAPTGDAAAAADVPAADVPAAGDVPDPGAPATGAAPEAGAPANGTGTLGDFSDLTYGNLIPDATQYTDQWQHIQYMFVDDPHASVTQAADVIAQVTAKLEAAIQERQRAIEERQRAIAEQQRTLRGRWGEGSNADTEMLRETLRMYRTFLDQLIGRRAG